MKNVICPLCGSSHITKSNYQEMVRENLGGSSLIDKVSYHCEDCEFEGDIFNENEPIIEKTVQSLKNDLVISILNDFSSNKTSFSSMERALGLPQRTLTKWKNGASSPTAAGVTLLKFIKLFPWLLEVAENDFEYLTAQRIHLNVACRKIVNYMTINEDMLTTASSGFFFFWVKPEDIKKEENIIDIGAQPLRLPLQLTEALSTY